MSLFRRQLHASHRLDSLSCRTECVKVNCIRKRRRESLRFLSIDSKPQSKNCQWGSEFCKQVQCHCPNGTVFPHSFFRSHSGVQLDPSKAWCPVLDCQAVCSVTPGSEGKPVPVPCPVCRAVFCCGCRSPWTDAHSCSQHQPLMTSSADRSVRPISTPTDECLSLITRPWAWRKHALSVVSAVEWAALTLMRWLNSVLCVAST